MTDPTGGIASKVAEDLAKEVQQAAQQAEQASKTQNVQGPQFQEHLQLQQIRDPGQVGDVKAVDQLRQAIQANRTPAAPAAGDVNNTRPVSHMQRIFNDVMAGQNKLEEIMNLALSGRNFSQSELLALQAGVYRFTQELELTSKVIEKGTSSIKQTLNTQV